MRSNPIVPVVPVRIVRHRHLVRIDREDGAHVAIVGDHLAPVTDAIEQSNAIADRKPKIERPCPIQRANLDKILADLAGSLPALPDGETHVAGILVAGSDDQGVGAR